MGTPHQTFAIGACLGRGGFGEVYRAELQTATGLTTEVAVKLLRQDVGAGQAVARLRDEGAMLARLNHPALLRVHDLVVIEGRVGLVTEYIEGEDLEQALTARSPIGLRALADVLAQVSAALAAAYDAPVGEGGAPLRLVHRDVKPSNVRLGRHGEVKLLDFGVARTDAMERRARTQTDTLVGSPPYMAPERFLDNEPRSASDVLAVGAVAVEPLIGRLFDVPVTMLATLAVDPQRYRAYVDDRLGSVPADAPPAYVALARQALDYDPVARPTASELARRFERLADELPGATFARWCRERRWADSSGVRGPFEGRVVDAYPLDAPEGVEAVAEARTQRRAEPTVDLTGRGAAPVRRAVTPVARSVPAPAAPAGPGAGFFGRSAELDALTEAWIGGARLATVWGPGGIGKTRLVAEHIRRDLPGLQLPARRPVVSVRLVDVVTRGGLLVAASDALELGPVTGAEDEHAARIGRALRHRGPLVLVLDNAEQLHDVVATEVAAWLAAAPELRVLVTSRRALGLPEEHLVEVGPLDPDAAFALFVDRARRVRWDYAPADDEHAALRELVSADLDGLPLAIELASGRVDLLDVHAISARLRQRFELLTDGRRPAPGASQWSSLRAALIGSWTLLSTEDQRALATCGVFAGGFDLEAAEVVLGGDANARLRSLVEHALLLRDGQRFRLLEAVAELARLQLAELPIEEVDGARARHRGWYAGQLAPHGSSLGTASGSRWITRLVAERANLRAAHASAVAARDIDAAVALAACLDALAMEIGPFAERLTVVEATLGALPPDHPRAVEIRWRHGDALRQLGRNAEAREVLLDAVDRGARVGRTSEAWTALLALFAADGDGASFHAHLDEALVAVRAAHDRRRECIILNNQAYVELSQGAIDKARALADEAVAIARSIGHVRMEVAALTTASTAANATNPSEALDLLAHASALARMHKMTFQEMHIVSNLANIRVRRSEFGAALDDYARALELARRLGDSPAEHIVRMGRSLALCDTGALDDAAAEVEALIAEFGQERGETAASAAVVRSVIERRRGRPREAELSLRSAIVEARQVGARMQEAYARVYLAAILAELHRPDEAEALLAGLDAFYADGGHDLGAALLTVARGQIAVARGADKAVVVASLASVRAWGRDVVRMIELLEAS